MSLITVSLKYVKSAVHEQKLVFVNELDAFTVVYVTSCATL